MHRIVIHCRSTARYAAKHLWVAVIDHPLLRAPPSATMVQRTSPGHGRLWRYRIQSPHSAFYHCI